MKKSTKIRNATKKQRSSAKATAEHMKQQPLAEPVHWATAQHLLRQQKSQLTKPRP